MGTHGDNWIIYISDEKYAIRMILGEFNTSHLYMKLQYSSWYIFDGCTLVYFTRLFDS